MDIDALVSQGVQQPLIDAWKANGISALTECQHSVLARETIWEGKNVLVVAPTSSGKTFVGEVLAAKSAYTLKRAIFLVPYKAIAEEKYLEFRQRYGELGVSVVISDGDHTTFDRGIRRGDFGIAVIVYEKMAQLLIQAPGILVDCSLIVVDEIQMIADRTRGPSLEILLTHIRQMAEQPQIIGLSATISDLGGLESWLDADVVDIQARPVPLWEGVAFPGGSSELENVDSKRRQPSPDVTSVTVPQSSWSSGSKLDVIYKILAAEGLSKQFLIFTTRVDDTASTARRLAHVLPAEPVTSEVRARISTLETTRVSEFLNQWIDKRVAYHNAGLSLQERRLIEQFFREGNIRVLVTTSTLAAGVNTPADVVIIADYKRYDFSRMSSVPISVEEYKNCVGRAGRFGISSEGRSYLIVDKPSETSLVKVNYIFGHHRRLRSSIPDTHDVGALALQFLALELMTNEDELKDLIRHSFAFHYYFQTENGREEFLVQFMESLSDLAANGLTDYQCGQITVTDLGEVASTSGMSLKSFYELLNALIRSTRDSPRISDLILAICKFSELSSLPPYDANERGKALGEWLAGRPTLEIIEEYSGRYEVGAGHIQRIGETAGWILNTAAGIAEVADLMYDGEKLAEELAGLAQRCRFGAPSAVIPIAELGFLHRSELNLLVNNSAGRVLDTAHKILDSDSKDFVGILSPRRARMLQERIFDRIGESLSSRKFGHLSRADRFGNLRPLVERCYVERGKDFEVALEDILISDYVDIEVHRFTQQRTGQPDLEISGSQGTVVIQATVSDDDKKPVNWAKAREVLSSVGYSGQAANFVTVARPCFHDVAIGNANEIASRRDQRLLLIPVTELIEVLLAEVEGKIANGGLLRVLEGAHGHFVAEGWSDGLGETS